MNIGSPVQHFFLASILAGSASAQTCSPSEISKLLPAEVGLADHFSRSVSISGNTALIGQYYEQTMAPSLLGSAYIYRLDGSTWVQEAILTASDGEATDFFGGSVAISGDVAVVSAKQDGDNGNGSGSAYIFRFDGASWVQEAKLLASDGAPYDKFGNAVAISGDTVVVGAFENDDVGFSSGSAYVFRYDGASWGQEAKLIANDAASNDQFGWTVSISGDAAVIGAHTDDDNGNDSGSAYIFRRDGTNWTQEAKLLASDGAAGQRFGEAASISNNVVLVGAYFGDNGVVGSGSAYVFRHDGANWTQEDKLIADDGESSDLFGISVSVSDDTALVGASGNDDSGSNSGSAYLFRFDGADWAQESMLLADDGDSGDGFGLTVSVSGNTTLIGATLDDDNGTNSGSAYIFNLNCTTPCLADVNGDGDVTPADFTAWIAAFNANAPECDQNGDGSCTPADFTAWIANFNAGCP